MAVVIIYGKPTDPDLRAFADLLEDLGNRVLWRNPAFFKARDLERCDQVVTDRADIEQAYRQIGKDVSRPVLQEQEPESTNEPAQSDFQDWPVWPEKPEPTPADATTEPSQQSARGRSKRRRR